MLLEIDKEDIPPSFKSLRFPDLRYLSKYFAQIYRAQYGATNMAAGK